MRWKITAIVESQDRPAAGELADSIEDNLVRGEVLDVTVAQYEEP